MDCSPPGSSVHGILQARTLESVAISFSKSSHRHYINKWVWPCSNKTLFIKISSGFGSRACWEISKKVKQKVNTVEVFQFGTWLKQIPRMGGGIRMGNTCKSMADSCQRMAKILQYCKVISLQLIKINGGKKKPDTKKSPSSRQFPWCFLNTLIWLYLKIPFFIFYWSIVDLQCCVSFWFTAKWFSNVYIFLFRFFSLHRLL